MFYNDMHMHGPWYFHVSFLNCARIKTLVTIFLSALQMMDVILEHGLNRSVIDKKNDLKL